MKKRAVVIGYYNVGLFLLLETEFDCVKYKYFSKRYNSEEELLMRDIIEWCKSQRIKYYTKFFYIKEISILENLWNYYNFARMKLKYNSLEIKF